MSGLVKIAPSDRHRRDVVKLQKVEDALYRGALSIVQDGLRGAEIDDDLEEVPESWNKELGSAGAKRAFRVAKDIRRPKSQRPGYFELAQNVVVGTARAREKQVFNAPLCVQVFFGDKQKEYPVIDVEPTET